MTSGTLPRVSVVVGASLRPGARRRVLTAPAAGRALLAAVLLAGAGYVVGAAVAPAPAPAAQSPAPAAGVPAPVVQLLGAVRGPSGLALLVTPDAGGQPVEVSLSPTVTVTMSGAAATTDDLLSQLRDGMQPDATLRYDRAGAVSSITLP